MSDTFSVSTTSAVTTTERYMQSHIDNPETSFIRVYTDHRKASHVNKQDSHVWGCCA